MTVLNTEENGTEESLGAYLARAREARSMSVTDLAVATRLSEKNISLIEASEWGAFPIEAYLRGYINSICQKLGLDAREVFERYDFEVGKVREDIYPELPPPPSPTSFIPQILKKPTFKFEVPGFGQPKTTSFRAPKTGAYETPRTGSFESTPRTGAFETPQTTSFATPKTGAYETPRTSSIESTPRTGAFETPQTTSFATPKTASMEVPRTGSSETPRTSSFEVPKTQSFNAPKTAANPTVSGGYKFDFSDDSSSNNKPLIIGIIAIVALLVVVSFCVRSCSKSEPEKNLEVEPAPVAEDTTDYIQSEESIVADIIKGDSAVTDSAPQPVATPAPAPETPAAEPVKKSELPASATIFISSNSKSDGGKTSLEIVGQGGYTSWVGIKRREGDSTFVKQAYISTPEDKLTYKAEDSLYIVIGEPRAIGKFVLNGVDTKIPPVKPGRSVTRFAVYDGAVVP